MVILTHVFFQNILEMPTVPTLHLVPSRKIPTCSTSSGDSSVSNLMLMDRGLVSDTQCVKAELGPAEFPTGTWRCGGRCRCRVRGPRWRWVVREVGDSVRADSPESRETDSVAQHGGTEPALLKTALGGSRVLATRPAGHGLAPQASELVTPPAPRPPAYQGRLSHSRGIHC